MWEDEAAAELSVCLETKMVRDKEDGGNTATVHDWVNSANAGFKVAELLSKKDLRILIFSIGSWGLQRFTRLDRTELFALWKYL